MISKIEKDEEFKIRWKSFYDNRKPLSWYLKSELNEKWFRIHSLPNGQRYAKTKEDSAIILHRCDTIADKILSGNDCWLVRSTSIQSKTIPKFENVPYLKSEKFQYTLELKIDEEETCQVWVLKSKWNSRKFKNLLINIAEDKIENIFFMNDLTGNIFAPYDGGIDLVINEEKESLKLKRIFKSWLSKHPDGL
ncbi:MAG: hypothetical protein GW938_15465 [Leptospira sp.]|nr:hypothetical protein [Leptospira sp.]